MQGFEQERQNMLAIKEQHGIKFNFSRMAAMFLQGGILVTWSSLVHRFSNHVEDYPEMLTGGFLWIKDLTSNDPLYILPLINCFSMIMNIYVSIAFY